MLIMLWPTLYNFLGIIYASSCDFDWGYADSDIIMSKKVYNIGHWSSFVKSDTFKFVKQSAVILSVIVLSVEAPFYSIPLIRLKLD